MPRLTAEVAMTIPAGRTLYHHIEKNRDGTPLRARTNGKCKYWKRPHSPQWQLPMKYALRQHFYINDTTVDEWFTVEDEARLFHLGYCIHPMKVDPFNDYVNYWFITCGNTHLPNHFPSFEEALKYGVDTHLVPLQKKAGFPVKEKA